MAQLEGYRALAADGLVRLSTVDCLDQCGRGDAIVVRPARAQRRSTGSVWLAGATAPNATAALRGWLAAGGPGAAELPDVLATHAVPPPGNGGLAAG
ncbi:MAG: hypothetical protein KQH57_11290 [Actinomycetales bacterium]|nr:hypothetical protein [Actinomycetales bacterium]